MFAFEGDSYILAIMKRFLLSFFVVFSFVVKAQINLVPNFSFEQHDSCPTNIDQIEFASGWSKYSISTSTPDYYNACAPASGFGVPKNVAGNQSAHRNCSAYAGLLTWGASGNDREHIGIQLTTPLVVGQKYFLSFYTVMGEDYYLGNQFGLPSNNIGLRLSTVSFNGNQPTPIDNFAHLYSSAIIGDSLNWQRISGSILADSAYEYVILGNFFDDTNTDTMQYSCGWCFNSESYYFIDDICISSDSLLANGGLDALSCTTSLDEMTLGEEISIFPNPVMLPKIRNKTIVIKIDNQFFAKKRHFRGEWKTRTISRSWGKT